VFETGSADSFEQTDGTESAATPPPEVDEVAEAARALSSRVDRLRNACVQRLGQKLFTEV
jgi:hypothetical protein